MYQLLDIQVLTLPHASSLTKVLSHDTKKRNIQTKNNNMKTKEKNHIFYLITKNSRGIVGSLAQPNYRLEMSLGILERLLLPLLKKKLLRLGNSSRSKSKAWSRFSHSRKKFLESITYKYAGQVQFIELFKQIHIFIFYYVADSIRSIRF